MPAERAGAATTSSHPSKVLVVVLENHSEAHALAGMPLLAQVAKRYSYTSDGSAIAHPSLPNYLAIIGGSTFGVVDDANPAAHPIRGASVLDQTIAQGRSAKTYAESMPANCTLVPAGRYAVKHNPWTYFTDRSSRANCLRNDVPSGSLTSGPLQQAIAQGTLPTVGLVIPNICDDAHDCALGVADKWLAAWMGQFMDGPDWRTGKLAIVVTFDEDDYSQANKVLTVVAYPTLHTLASKAPINHYSLTGLLDSLTGSAPLRGAKTAPPFRHAFNL